MVGVFAMTPPFAHELPAHHRRGILLMLGSAAFFVANLLIVRGLNQTEHINVWIVSCARFVIGLLLVVIWYRQDWEPLHLFRSRKLIERGIVGGAGVVGFYYTVLHLGAGRATFINNTYLIWGALLAVLLLRERMRPLLVVGSVAALGGLGLLTGAFATGAQVSGYDVVAILTAIGSGYVVVTIRHLHAAEHSSTIFSAQCVYGLLVCGIPALLHPQAIGLAAGLWLTVASVCAGAGQLMMTRAFRDLSVAEGSLLQMTVPLGIAAGEFALFGERFTVPELIGGALILGGCMLPALKR